MLRRVEVWLILFGAVGAPAFGWFAYTGKRIALHPPFFFPKLYAGYVVFSLGAAIIPLLWSGVILGWITWRRLASGRWIRPLCGVAALVLPVAYYLPQMFSPRYWTPAVVAMLIGVTGRRTGALFGQQRLGIAISTLTLAVLPLFFGVMLPFADHPRLTEGYPTEYPTADGHQPMGAIIPFLRRMVNASEHVIDHNQATWLAAREVNYQTDAEGAVPILDFSLRSYIQLATALRGIPSRVVPIEAPSFYSDVRDLVRKFHTPDRFTTASRREEAALLDVRPADAARHGAQIVRATKGKPSSWWKEQTSVSAPFGGNMFRILDAQRSVDAAIVLGKEHAGKTLVFFDRQPFTMQIGKQSVHSDKHADELFFVRIPGRQWFGQRVAPVIGSPQIAISVHPDYMAADRLR